MNEVPNVVRPGARILVVEDNADAAQTLAKLLGMFGHDVRIAADGPWALATTMDWRPDIVLLDLGLPGMDGYQVARRLRDDGSCREALIIAVTGYGQAEYRQRSLAAGFDHHLLKPVDLDLLLSLIAAARGTVGETRENFACFPDIRLPAALA